MTNQDLHLTLHHDEDGMWWSEIEEMPGCFSSALTLEALLAEHLPEAIDLWNSEIA